MDPVPDLAPLLRSELRHSAAYLRRLRDLSLDPAARLSVVDWILEVGDLQGFRPATIYLAVEYVDRFLSGRALPAGGWPWQLLAVASLSVAAKMEEIQVPALADLQATAPRFAFCGATVMRMELLLMSALGWRMRSVTPFDYLELIAGDAGTLRPPRHLIRRASDLVLATCRVVEFLAFRPSAIAVAAILCAMRESGDVLPDLESYLATFPDDINKENVLGQDCCRLMKACIIGECTRAGSTPAEPRSPDVAACPSRKVNKFELEPESEYERIGPPPCKRRRLDFLYCRESLYIEEDERNQ